MKLLLIITGIVVGGWSWIDLRAKHWHDLDAPPSFYTFCVAMALYWWGLNI